MSVGIHRHASLGQRVIAFFVDSVITGIVGGVVLFVLVWDAIQTGNIVGVFVGGLMFFALTWIYFIVLEGLWGITFGKRLIGIEVTDANGDHPGLLPAFVRNVLRLVDQLPQLYIVGILLIYVNDDNQRLGDMVANTYVRRR